VRARLINPERVTIQPIDRSTTRTDDLAGEHYARIARSTELVILGQVDESNRNSRGPGQGGAKLTERASIAFLAEGTQRPDGSWTGIGSSGWVPSSGDRITGIAAEDGTEIRAVSWYVSEAHGSGKERRRRRLVVISIEDRHPTREGSEGGL
jgi:hypothetical protein